MLTFFLLQIYVNVGYNGRMHASVFSHLISLPLEGSFVLFLGIIFLGIIPYFNVVNKLELGCFDLDNAALFQGLGLNSHFMHMFLITSLFCFSFVFPPILSFLKFE